MDAMTKGILALFHLNTDLLMNCLDGLSEEDLLLRISPETNPMSFLVLHLIDTRYVLIKDLGEQANHPFQGMLENANSVDDVKVFPKLSELRVAWHESFDILQRILRLIDPSLFFKKSNRKYPVDDPTVLAGLYFLMQHESYHLGQIAFLRKIVAKKPMSYRRT